MATRVAIIGGTGIGSRLLEEGARPVHVPTRYGLVRAKELEDATLILARHGSGHKTPPHLVNYTAMSEALVILGVEYCFSSAAVGSLRADWLPGTLSVCSDLIDVSGRETVRFADSPQHTDMTEAFDPKARNALLRAAGEASIDVEDGGVYLCVNGPRYETPAEIAAYQMVGVDVVGMTAGTEAVAMREAGIRYACLAVVSNLAAGLHQSTLSHDEVVEQMSQTGDRAVAILTGAMSQIEKV